MNVQLLSHILTPLFLYFKYFAFYIFHLHISYTFYIFQIFYIFYRVWVTISRWCHLCNEWMQGILRSGCRTIFFLAFDFFYLNSSEEDRCSPSSWWRLLPCALCLWDHNKKELLAAQCYLNFIFILQWLISNFYYLNIFRWHGC